MHPTYVAPLITHSRIPTWKHTSSHTHTNRHTYTYICSYIPKQRLTWPRTCSYVTNMWHLVLQWAATHPSCVSWCCSDPLAPPGPAPRARFPFPVHLLLCVDRTTWCCCWLPDFGLSCITMGQRAVWTDFPLGLPGSALPLALQRQRLSSPVVHTWMHGHSGMMRPHSHTHTFKLLINVSLCLWPPSGPQGSQ